MEKLDEVAFHRKHMFQIIIFPKIHHTINKQDEDITLYLQAAVSASGGRGNGEPVGEGVMGSLWGKG